MSSQIQQFLTPSPFGCLFYLNTLNLLKSKVNVFKGLHLLFVPNISWWCFGKKGDSFCKKGILLVKKEILLVKTNFLFLFCQACSEYDDESVCHNDVLASITVLWSFVANLSRTEEPRSTKDSDFTNCSKICETYSLDRQWRSRFMMILLKWFLY